MEDDTNVLECDWSPEKIVCEMFYEYECASVGIKKLCYWGSIWGRILVQVWLSLPSFSKVWCGQLTHSYVYLCILGIWVRLHVGLNIGYLAIKKTNLDLPGLLKNCKDDAGVDQERLSERIVLWSVI